MVYIFAYIYLSTYVKKYFGGETTREETVLGRNDKGMWGETTRVENRGETTRGETTRGGGNGLGAKRLVTVIPAHDLVCLSIDCMLIVHFTAPYSH